jgi:Flp pilus assembly protein TadD
VAMALAPAVEEIWTWVWRGFLGVVFICFSIVTWNLVANYESEGSLWSATLAKNPNSWQAHNHLGAWLYMHGDIKGAYPHFLAATQFKPENPESHNNLGLALSYFGQLQKSPEMEAEAVQQYELAVKIKPDPSMETNLGNAYEEVGRFADALKTYQLSLSLNPNADSTWCNMGFALMKMGNIDDAITCFIRSLELNPGMPQGRKDLAVALSTKGINPSAPVLTGTYHFDVQKAIELARKYPPLPGQ